MFFAIDRPGTMICLPMPPAYLILPGLFVEMGGLTNFLLKLALNLDPSDLYLLSSLEYNSEPTPGLWGVFSELCRTTLKQSRFTRNYYSKSVLFILFLFPLQPSSFSSVMSLFKKKKIRTYLLWGRDSLWQFQIGLYCMLIRSLLPSPSFFPHDPLNLLFQNVEENGNPWESHRKNSYVI
jgi:hypothetical protein